MTTNSNVCVLLSWTTIQHLLFCRTSLYLPQEIDLFLPLSVVEQYCPLDPGDPPLRGRGEEVEGKKEREGEEGRKGRGGREGKGREEGKRKGRKVKREITG